MASEAFDIDAIEKRAKAATSGPWTTEKPIGPLVSGFTPGLVVAAVARGQCIYADPPGGSFPESDRRFIAHAREDIPALIAEIRRLRALPTSPSPGERWRPACGDAKYEVSDRGRVRHAGGAPVGQWPSGQGYLRVRLNDPRRIELVHRLVATAFLENPEEKPAINHIDNDRSNNVLSNLEWCTQAENLAHARRQGRMPDNYWVGRRSPNARLTSDQVLEIRKLHSEGRTLRSLAEEFKIGRWTIGRIVNREAYTNV